MPAVNDGDNMDKSTIQPSSTIPVGAPGDMRREFTSRDELIAYLRQQFPEAAEVDAHVAEVRGGRQAALAVLERIEPAEYAATRNHIAGKVTRLSPYIRYGVLSLAEVRDRTLRRIRRRAEGEKFINELAWRDYWQRVYRKFGDGIWHDREPYKTGFTAAQYARTLPHDIDEGTTGLACIDAFSADLRQTGYLHNHVRMWLASYIVHWRRVQWQAGARWFLSHLLDGDPASNNLSWQWVASTFSHKPYYFNRGNLNKYTDGVYCQRCPLFHECPFEGSYEQIEARLFPDAQPSDNYGSNPQRRPGRNSGGSFLRGYNR
jgi:deoxyribodipyrimidine photo-lyase